MQRISLSSFDGNQFPSGESTLVNLNKCSQIEIWAPLKIVHKYSEKVEKLVFKVKVKICFEEACRQKEIVFDLEYKD